MNLRSTNNQIVLTEYGLMDIVTLQLKEKTFKKHAVSVKLKIIR